MKFEKDAPTFTGDWPSAVPRPRWTGFRRDFPGTEAFKSVTNFKTAQQSELFTGLSQHERATLGRLLKRGQRLELDLFIRTHGANPIFDPHAEIEVPLGIAKADIVDLETTVEPDAIQSILRGEIVHTLFQAGEATRFEKGPFYRLNPTRLARSLRHDHPELQPLLDQIERLAADVPPKVAEFIVDGQLGPKQSVMIRAAIRKIISHEIVEGRIKAKAAAELYTEALRAQKILYFMSQHAGVGENHDRILREEYKFYGFSPQNIVTIEQELIPGIHLDEDGNIFLREEPWASDAVGHLYALVQATRLGDFTTYTESGRPIKPMEVDALGYLSSRGAKYLNVIRINDMDRHTTEIINAKALAYALSIFKKGYVNAIEGVSNPAGHKGGTGVTLGDSEIHILTETHENSFPSLSRVFESAMKIYLDNNEGRHPAYNAMRQWADLSATRQAVREFGGRIVFVPRSKTVNGEQVWYLGVDMPMGDLSLLGSAYKSRMFQFTGPNNRQLLIHDMKQTEQLALYLKVVMSQLANPHILAATKEILLTETIPFEKDRKFEPIYDAPAPEFEV